jgi:hypothetical protein
LTVFKYGTGGGTVTISPPNVDCVPKLLAETTIGADTSNFDANSCIRTFPPFPATVTVTLTATPDADSIFGGWQSPIECLGRETCQVTMAPTPPSTRYRSAMANFFRLADTHALTVTKTGTGEGTVTSSPSGINCGTDCSENYWFDPQLGGVPVTLTATPMAGSTFAGWGGACSGTGVSCYIFLNAAKNATAAFTASGP